MNDSFKKYFLGVFVILAIILSYKIIKPFIIPITLGMILTYLFFPVYKIISKKTSKNIAATITIFIIIAAIIIPFILLSNIIILQIKNLLVTGYLEQVTKQISEIILSFLKNTKLIDYLPSVIEKSEKFSFNIILSALSSIPSMILNFFVILFISFYFFTDSEKIISKIKENIPLKNKESLIIDIKNTLNILVFGITLISIIEFIVSAIGLKLLGIQPYLLLAFIIGIAAFIPAIGAGIVWVPLFFIKIFQHQFLTSIGILILGIILSYGIDIIIRIKMIKTKSKIHPVVMLIGILGGVNLFGISGLIIGPLILLISIHILKIISKTN